MSAVASISSGAGSARHRRHCCRCKCNHCVAPPLLFLFSLPVKPECWSLGPATAPHYQAHDSRLLELRLEEKKRQAIVSVRPFRLGNWTENSSFKSIRLRLSSKIQKLLP